MARLPGLLEKKFGDVAAARFAVRDQLAEEELVRGEVEDEQPRLRRRQRVIDDRQQVALRDSPLSSARVAAASASLSTSGRRPGACVTSEVISASDESAARIGTANARATAIDEEQSLHWSFPDLDLDADDNK